MLVGGRVVPLCFSTAKRGLISSSKPPIAGLDGLRVGSKGAGVEFVNTNSKH